MIKVAILEASHWHVPLYIAGLQSDGIKVVAVSDAEQAKGPDVAANFSAKFYQCYKDLLASETIDFAFCFGRHCDMARMASDVIDKGIAFSIEKPGGVSCSEVKLIQEKAEEKNLFVAVPFIFRVSELMKHLEGLDNSHTENWRHMSFRFIAGPLERYKNANCSWMLQKELAGGGCSINLAVHFIDLFLHLTKEKIISVAAQMIDSKGSGDVEIYSRITFTTESGKICGIETGYTFPADAREQREFSFSIASDRHYIQSDGANVQIIPRDGTAQSDLNIELNTDVYYSVFVCETLAQLQKDVRPAANLADLKRAMVIIDGAYKSARNGGQLVIL